MKEKNIKYTIMIVGKTHSGKTTFAEQLQFKNPNMKILQTDPISIFLKENYGHDINRDKEHDGTFSNPSLKVKVFRTIFQHMIHKGASLILSNSNAHQKLRNELINEMHSYGYNVIGIYLNFTEEFLMSRVSSAKKDIIPLNSTTSFPELLIRQRDLFIEPRDEEFDYFFEVKKEEDIPVIQKKIINLVTKNTS